MYLESRIPSPSDSYWVPRVAEHRRWLAPFDPRYTVIFERQLASKAESALLEVWYRKELEARGIFVAPNEELDGREGGPDFYCLKDDYEFFVEVTCITIKQARRRLDATSLRGSPVRAIDVYGMPEAITSECQGKVKQCARAIGPVLLAIGSLTSKPPCAALIASPCRWRWLADPG